MSSMAHPKPHPTPVPAFDECPANCTLPDMILCWLRRSRELRADLVAAHGCADAEVLVADLAAAERQIDALIAFGRRVA
jgi:hypothetical protein